MNTNPLSATSVHLSAVTKSFGTNSHCTYAVRAISFEACSGELILLLGPSGSGKTTLLTLMAGLIRPSAGTVSLFGNDIVAYSDDELQRLRARRVGFVFQNFLLIESLTVEENIALVLRFGGKDAAVARQEAARLLESIGITHLAKMFPHRLSQGEKQRVAVARAIANGGELIIADEPTASLESKQGLEIIRLLQTLAKEQGKCVVVATHDLRLVDYADKTLHLRDGEVVRVEERILHAEAIGVIGAISVPVD
jgi:putative ABC transport system ATP-binding protein